MLSLALTWEIFVIHVSLCKARAGEGCALRSGTQKTAFY